MIEIGLNEQIDLNNNVERRTDLNEEDDDMNNKIEKEQIDMGENPNKENDGSNKTNKVPDPYVGMRFDSGQEFAKYCHRYASSRGFAYHTRTCELLDEFKEKSYGRRKSGEEPQYYMLKRLRLECGKGGKEKKMT